MSIVELRPSEPGDLEQVWDQPLHHRLRGVTMLIDGKVSAVGGLVFYPCGDVWIGAFITPAARRAPVTLHRAGARIMRDAAALGLTRLFASVDPAEPRSETWVRRFGFEPTLLRDAGRRVWLWRRKESR